jgi:hypothetical protein
VDLQAEVRSYRVGRPSAQEQVPVFHGISQVSVPAVRRLPVASGPRHASLGQVILQTGAASIRPLDVDWSLLLRTTSYRLWLIVSTIVLTYLLYRLQNLLGAVPANPSTVQKGVQWAELIWLVPVPLSIGLWLGWLIFAEVGRPDPSPIPAPRVLDGQPVRLVVRIVTRGDNASILRESVNAVHRSFACYPQVTGPYRIEVVSDHEVDLGDRTGLTHLVVVPPDYAAPAGTLYKARALTYLQSVTPSGLADWYLLIDEESKLDSSVIAGIYRFISRRCRDAGRGRPPAKIIGQGAILYQGGHWFFRGADSLRTADDLGRFRLQYALGWPLFGIHGSYILISGADNQRLSFDVGPANSLTEDAAWALRAWAAGYRFGWVEGYLHEQPPQHVMDFVHQRARWLSGIRQVITDRTVPYRYRVCLTIFTALWQLAFLPFVVAVTALAVHIAPFAWMRIPADFAWAAFVLAYLQGAHVQATRQANFYQEPKSPSFLRLPEVLWQGLLLVSSWMMSLCYIWFALLEASAVLYSLKPRQGFFVIRKPSFIKAPKLDPGHLHRDRPVIRRQAPLEPSG